MYCIFQASNKEDENDRLYCVNGHDRIVKFSIIYILLLVIYLVSPSRTGYSLCTCNFTVGKQTSKVPYGYRKCGTHARVFTQTLAHGKARMK